MKMMNLIIILVTLVVFIGLGFMMSKSIKKMEAKPKGKKKKGSTRYLPQVKNMGK